MYQLTARAREDPHAPQSLDAPRKRTCSIERTLGTWVYPYLVHRPLPTFIPFCVRFVAPASRFLHWLHLHLDSPTPPPSSELGLHVGRTCVECRSGFSLSLSLSLSLVPSLILYTQLAVCSIDSSVFSRSHGLTDGDRLVGVPWGRPEPWTVTLGDFSTGLGRWLYVDGPHLHYLTLCWWDSFELMMKNLWCITTYSYVMSICSYTTYMHMFIWKTQTTMLKPKKEALLAFKKYTIQ